MLFSPVDGVYRIALLEIRSDPSRADCSRDVGKHGRVPKRLRLAFLAGRSVGRSPRVEMLLRCQKFIGDQGTGNGQSDGRADHKRQEILFHGNPKTTQSDSFSKRNITDITQRNLLRLRGICCDQVGGLYDPILVTVCKRPQVTPQSLADGHEEGMRSFASVVGVGPARRLPPSR